MEDSDGSNHEDVWSPTLREDVFSNHDMMGPSWSIEPRHHLEHLSLPNFNSIRSQPLNPINWPNFPSHHQQRGHSNTAPTKSSSSSSSTQHPLSTTSVNRTHSHLDLPNFPLQAVCIFQTRLFLSRTVVDPQIRSDIEQLSTSFRLLTKMLKYEPTDSGMYTESGW